jgi:hypothetical protein
LKLPRLLTVAAVFAALASATLGAPAARGEETPPLRLTIAFTGDVSGYLEPCG